ncbi:hypothetical protein AV530_004576 [Patagioenas fasciata monilis]|uniref:Uncharacterized protein n=1 Tax=Patagioenas fasciata monilis TaxID=372326 RepID=A0A1V4KJ77_PATFA|nr:hypothetical protein AV530_004576 [Patagioenas fasciata monilis]
MKGKRLLTPAVFNSTYFRQISDGKRTWLFTRRVGNGSARGFGEQESLGRGSGSEGLTARRRRPPRPPGVPMEWELRSPVAEQ